jgi:hypothetical protein
MMALASDDNTVAEHSTMLLIIKLTMETRWKVWRVRDLREGDRFKREGA